MEAFLKVLPYIVSLASGSILCVCTYKITKALNRREQAVSDAETKSMAIAAGVQCLLRESIIRDFNKWQERGYCPIYAKESIKSAYAAYHKLDGNDVATELYTKLLALPEEKVKDGEE